MMTPAQRKKRLLEEHGEKILTDEKNKTLVMMMPAKEVLGTMLVLNDIMKEMADKGKADLLKGGIMGSMSADEMMKQLHVVTSLNMLRDLDKMLLTTLESLVGIGGDSDDDKKS